MEGTTDVCIRNSKEDDDRNGLVDEQNSQRQDSPGPPPLEFNKDRPQRMWGHDSTQPISLTHALTHQTTSPKEDNIIEPSLISPKTPDYSPPKHYTLLAARRKRFRRPGKT